VYANVGCCIVEYPCWFSLVLRAVGLIGEGDRGVLGMFMAIGDLSDRAGRDAFPVAAAILTESLGLTARAVYMLTDDSFS